MLLKSVGAILGLLLLYQPVQASLEPVEVADESNQNPVLGFSLKAAPNRFGSLIDAAEYYSTLPAMGWRAIDEGPLLYPGQRHRQVEQLRHLLTLYGDYRLPPHGRVDLKAFDYRLVSALKRFQQRNGLKPDGVIGPNTRLTLNVPPEVRVFQLLLNHERQLALRSRTPERYIQVNLPEFRLRLYEGEATRLEMKTIVGRKSRSTPVLESEIKSLLLNPPWNVPRSIAEKDILPKWQADAEFLKRQKMRIVSGWGRSKQWVDPEQTSPERLYKGREYLRLYQLPGRHNALGQIKFDSPTVAPSTCTIRRQVAVRPAAAGVQFRLCSGGKSALVGPVSIAGAADGATAGVHA